MSIPELEDCRAHMQKSLPQAHRLEIKSITEAIFYYEQIAAIVRKASALADIERKLGYKCSTHFSIYLNLYVQPRHRESIHLPAELPKSEIHSQILQPLNQPAMEVVSRIIEIASGRSIDQYFKEEIFAPLGMQETSFYLVPAMEGRIPMSYSLSTSGVLRPAAQFLEPEYLPTSRLTSYRVLSTPIDFLRFAQMLLNGGELDGERVLSRASVAAMMSNRISPSLTPIVTRVWNHTGYGFGLGGAVLVDSTISQSPASPGTYRWAGSSGTCFWIDPELDLIAILFYQNRGMRKSRRKGCATAELRFFVLLYP